MSKSPSWNSGQPPCVALDAAQIDGDLALELGVDRLAEIVPQQHVFGRNGGVGLELEHPMAVGLLPRRAAPSVAAPMARSSASSAIRLAVGVAWCQCIVVSESVVYFAAKRRRPALPERIAPSIVAGRPVAVQSPARQRLRHAVARAGPLGVLCAASPRRSPAARARSATAAGGRAMPGDRRDLAPDRRGELLARRVEQPVGAADRDRQPVREGEQPFDRAVDHADDRRQCRAAASMRKCALTMARNSVGAVEAGHQRGRDHRRHREDHARRPAPSAQLVVAEIERRDAVAVERRARAAAGRTRPCRRAPRGRRAPARRTRSPSPSRAISGRQALPARASVSRMHRARRAPPSPPAARC